MIRFEIDFSDARNINVNECLFEIIEHDEKENKDYQTFNIDLNLQEVKQLLDLIQETYAIMEKIFLKPRNRTSPPKKKRQTV